jgi:hypothetical protein
VKPCHPFSVFRLCLGIAASFFATGLVQAQTEGTPAPKEKAAAAAGEVERISQNLNDIELLRPLLTLNLTQALVDSLVATMKEIAAEWREVKKMDDAAMKALESEIDKVHADALIGIPIPKDFDAKFAAAQKVSATRYNDARLKGLKRLVLHLSDSLTAPQKDRVEAWSVQTFGGRVIPKKYQANPSKAPKVEVQALAIAGLVERTLLFDRTLVLLQQFKPTASAAAAPAQEGPAPVAPAAK